jgi:hypothetical protein
LKKIKKIAKHTGRSVIALVLLLLLLIGGAYYFINSSWGEKWMAHKLSDYLGEQMGDSVIIGHLDVQLPNTLVLDNIVVYDHHKNVMFNLHHVYAQIGYFNSILNKLTLSHIELNGVVFNLHRYKGDSSSNFGYVLHELSPPGDTTHSKNPFKIQFSYVKINDLHFKWDDENYPYGTPGVIDWDHLKVDDMHGIFTDLSIVGDNVKAKVKELGLREQTGFLLTNLTTNFSYTDTSMEYDYLSLRTPYTFLTDYLRFDYKDIEDFDDFIDKVQMHAELDNSMASFKDISHFTDELKNKSDQVAINSATVNGTVADMRVRGMNVSFGNYSFADGRVALRGLPDINETYIDAHLRAARTSRQELDRYFPELELPMETAKLGKVSAEGDFTGFLNDFVAFGTLNTDIGQIRSDVNLKLKGKPSDATYSGTLALKDFNIGKYLEDPLYGVTTMQGKISGQGLDIKTMHAAMEGAFERFDFNKYSYKNLAINGTISRSFFNGRFNADDPHLKVDFNGSVDFSGQKPAFDFIARIDKMHLKALNFTKDSLAISTLLNIDASGSSVDNLEGKVEAFNTSIRTKKVSYHLDSMDLKSEINCGERFVRLNSSILSAVLSGHFKPSQLPDLFKSAWNTYTDAGIMKFKVNPIEAQDIDFDIQFKNTEPIFTVLRQDITVKDSGYLKGHVETGGDHLKLNAYLPDVRYGKYEVNKLDVNANGLDDTLGIHVKAAQFYVADSMMAKDVAVNVYSANKGLSFTVAASDQTAYKKVDVAGYLSVSNRIATLRLDTSHLQISDTVWKIAAKPVTIYGDTMVDFPLLNFSYGDEALKVIGKYSAHHSYPIRAVLEDVNVRHITAFAPQFSNFGGRLNGQTLITNINEKPIIEAAVFANPFTYGKDTLGYLRLTADFDQATQRLSIDGNVMNALQGNVISADGYVAFDQSQAINVNVSLNKTNLAIFEPVVSGVFSDLTGEATADVLVRGTIDKPELQGKVFLENAGLTVDYLKTRYHFSEDVDLKGKIIEINDAEVFDAENHRGTVNGVIDLHNFSNPGFNLKINATDFQVLNTTQKDNDLYFGTAYGTGYVTVTGDMDNLAMYIKMRTEKKTVFSMPISEGTSFSGYDFIRFTSSNKFLSDVKKVDLNGLTLNMDIEVTPDATAQIIFDPRVGDILEAQGHGNLRMDISTDGDFNMYGTYTIDRGQYLFTALNVFNKNFTLKPGGTLTWQGDPYAATMNVKAAYSLHTSLKPLLPASIDSDPTGGEYSNRTFPVDALLTLTGPLLSPDVKLDFDVQDINTVNGAAQSILMSQIRSIKGNDEELTRQVASLLIFNQFLTPNEGVGANELSSGGVSNLGDLVSNQINYILSRVMPNLQVGFDLKNTETTFRVSKDFNQEKGNVSVSYDFTKNNYNVQGSYKISDDGSTRVNVFSRSNNDPTQFQNMSTTGVGIFKRKEFNKLSDLFQKKSKKIAAPKKKPESKPLVKDNKVTEK